MLAMGTHANTSVTSPAAAVESDPEDETPWHTQPALTVCDRLNVSPSGLTPSEAAARLAKVGPNEMGADRPPSPWRMLLRSSRVHSFTFCSRR